jgi:hypothetical protein
MEIEFGMSKKLSSKHNNRSTVYGHITSSNEDETNRFPANGNPTLCTSVVVPGGLPCAIPCLSNTKNPYKKRTD